MKRLLSIALMLMMSIAIFAKGDIKTVIYTPTPVMHCEGCENKIKNHLKFEKGIKKIETNVKKQTVTITYDAKKTSLDKIEKAFKKLKYQVEMVKFK